MKLVSLNTALAATLLTNRGTVQSGIRKTPRQGPVAVQPLGLEGDEQADPSVHGGITKAVYAYPQEHYAFWQTVRAQAGAQTWGETLAPGALGENLTITGLIEAKAWIGDLLRFPDCELAVSEPRYPCFKFNAVMGFKQAAKMMVKSGWCGFYLAVRSPGTIEAGQSFELVPGPREVNIRELFYAKAG
ncbi:MAG: MOSC domain-containing protein [Paucibacter sp.]|nr:MOSC domain-containing protein [Roseateles sp.]